MRALLRADVIGDGVGTSPGVGVRADAGAARIVGRSVAVAVAVAVATAAGHGFSRGGWEVVVSTLGRGGGGV